VHSFSESGTWCAFGSFSAGPPYEPESLWGTQRALVSSGFAVLIVQLLSCVQAAPWGLAAPWAGHVIRAHVNEIVTHPY